MADDRGVGQAALEEDEELSIWLTIGGELGRMNAADRMRFYALLRRKLRRAVSATR